MSYPYDTITEAAARHTKLLYDRKSGRYFGTCPVCHETSGTFAVEPKKGYFYCYSCGARGGKKELAELMNRTRTWRPVRQPKDPVLLSIYRDAAVFYFETLTSEDGTVGRDYLARRGLTDADFEEYGLGFAPDAFDELYRRLLAAYPETDVMRSGLVKVSKNGNVYDFFRNRVMFPIMDENDDVIAFGGRVMDDSKPKYINSPESAIFSKRRNLYGFPYQGGTGTGTLVICEGYMDQIAVNSTRMADSCAILGTALTKEHACEIAARYRKVALALDSDNAGRHAAKASIAELRKTGIEIVVPDFRPAKDPDEFIRKFGAERFMERIGNAISADTFLMRYADKASDIVDVLMRQAG